MAGMRTHAKQELTMSSCDGIEAASNGLHYYGLDLIRYLIRKQEGFSTETSGTEDEALR